MSEPAPNQLLSIGAAVDLLRGQFPDVSHSSLRFLEREGLLNSTRTAGGHRMYSPSDINRVLLIKTWQREGRSLDEIRAFLEARNQLLDPAQLSETFLTLALASQLEQAGQLILQADRVGLDPQILFFSVLQPALVRLGEEWASGNVSVHQEKEISVLCRELVTEITLRHAPAHPNDTLFVSACVAGERHEIGISMVNGLLRQHGYRVRYLGADVATVFLIEAVAAGRPDAVLLSSSMEESFPGCIEAVTAIRALGTDGWMPHIVVGGEITERRARQLVELGAVPVRDASMVLQVEELLTNGRGAADQSNSRS